MSTHDYPTPTLLRPTLGLLPVLAISAAVGGPAMAQTTGTTELDTIVVQGQPGGEAANSYTTTDSASAKRPAPLIDTPKSVTVITRKQIQERGATTVADVLGSTPGITIRAGEGGVQAGDNVFIRGFDASTETLIDGVRNSARTSYEAFNLDSIEVTRGSDGSEAGAGAEGGSVNLTTKVPVAGDFDDVSLSVGTGGYKRATLDSNREVGALGLRLNLMVQDADDLGGKKGKTSKRLGIAPSLSYAFGEGSKLTTGLYYYKNEDMPDYGVRMSGTGCEGTPYCVGSGTADDPWQPINVPTGTFYGTPGRDFTDSSNASGYVRFDHDFSDTLRFSATLRKNRDVTRYYVTQPGISPTGVTRGNKSTDRETGTLSFNAQLSGEGQLFGLAHRFGVGVDLSRAETTAYRVVTGTPNTPPPVDYVNPDLGFYPVEITTGDPSSIATTRTRSIYAFDVIDLAPQWQATVGLNFSQYDVSNLAIATDGVETRTAKTSNLTNGSVGIVYKPSDMSRFYATLSTASKPVGLGDTPTEGNGTGNVNLDPETSKSLEIGTKWLLMDQQLMLTAAAFVTDKDNMRVRSADGVTFDNIGSARSKGVELGFAGQITEKWGISGGYVYQDVRSTNGGFTTAGATLATDGKQLAKIPRHSFSVWTTYDMTERFTFGGGATYVGERVATYDSTTGVATAILPSSWRVDVMASYAVSDSTKLQLNVNNLFDERIYGDSHVTQHVYTEPGRNFTLSLNHRF